MPDDLVSVVFKWLDDAFYGVSVVGDFVMVALAPDPPLLVRLVDVAEPIGRQFDLRAPFLRDVGIRPELFEAIVRSQDELAEGHVRLVRGRDNSARGHLQIRYRLASSGMDQHRLVQLGLRLSGACKILGPALARAVGGTLITSPSNDVTPTSLGFTLD